MRTTILSVLAAAMFLAPALGLAAPKPKILTSQETWQVKRAIAKELNATYGLTGKQAYGSQKVKLVNTELLPVARGPLHPGLMFKSIAASFTAVPKTKLGGMAGTCNARETIRDFGPSSWLVSNIQKTANLRIGAAVDPQLPRQ